MGLYLTVILACRLILHLRHAYYQPILVEERRVGTGLRLLDSRPSTGPEQIDLQPVVTDASPYGRNDSPRS